MIKRHIIHVRKLTEDRYSSGTNMRLPGNADATDVRSAAEECIHLAHHHAIEIPDGYG